jgi:hypothetical protein
VRPARSPCAATPRRGGGGRSDPSGADDGSHRRQTRSGPSSPQPRPRTGRSDSTPPARWQRFPPRSPSPKRSPDPTPCVYDRPPATSPILHCAPPPLFRFATTSEPPAEPSAAIPASSTPTRNQPLPNRAPAQTPQTQPHVALPAKGDSSAATLEGVDGWAASRKGVEHAGGAFGRKPFREAGAPRVREGEMSGRGTLRGSARTPAASRASCSSSAR